MCLSKPQKVLEVKGNYAVVEFLGKTKTIKAPFSLKSGDYVVSQNNIAVHKIPRREALKMIREWEELNNWMAENNGRKNETQDRP